MGVPSQEEEADHRDREVELHRLVGPHLEMTEADLLFASSKLRSTCHLANATVMRVAIGVSAEAFERKYLVSPVRTFSAMTSQSSLLRSHVGTNLVARARHTSGPIVVSFTR